MRFGPVESTNQLNHAQFGSNFKLSYCGNSKRNVRKFYIIHLTTICELPFFYSSATCIMLSLYSKSATWYVMGRQQSHRCGSCSSSLSTSPHVELWIPLTHLLTWPWDCWSIRSVSSHNLAEWKYMMTTIKMMIAKVFRNANTQTPSARECLQVSNGVRGVIHSYAVLILYLPFVELDCALFVNSGCTFCSWGQARGFQSSAKRRISCCISNTRPKWLNWSNPKKSFHVTFPANFFQNPQKLKKLRHPEKYH